MILATWLLEINFFDFSDFYCFAVKVRVRDVILGQLRDVILGQLRDLPHSKNDF